MLSKFLNILSSYKKVLQNTFYLSILEAVHILIPFVALPYIIKTVGALNYGKVVFAQTVVTYFTAFVSFGFDILAVKMISRNRDKQKRLRLIVGAMLVLKVCTFCVGLLLFSTLVFCWGRARADWPLFFSAYLICLTEVFFTPWFFQGIEKMFVITVVRGTSMLLYIGGLLLCLHERSQYWIVPLLQSTALLLTALYGFYYMCRKEKVFPALPSIAFMKHFFKNSFPFFMSRISVIVNNSIATLVIGMTLGNFEVAVYDLALKIARMALVPVYMLTQAIFPHNAKNRDSRFALRAFGGLLSVSILGLTVLFFIAPYLVDFLGHGQLADAVPILRFLELYILVGVCAVYSGTPLLVAWGYSKPFNDSVFISTTFLLILYAFFGLCGVRSMYYFAAALLVSELIILGYRSFFCVKYKIFSLK